MQKYSLRWILLMAAGLLVSCSGKEAVSDDLLSTSELAAVLADIYVSEVNAVVIYDLKLQKDKFIKEYVYPRIFEKHEISDSVFYRSYDYYEQHPESFELLMDSVIGRIEAMELDSVRPSRMPRSIEEAYKNINALEAQRKRNANKDNAD